MRVLKLNIQQKSNFVERLENNIVDIRRKTRRS